MRVHQLYPQHADEYRDVQELDAKEGRGEVNETPKERCQLCGQEIRAGTDPAPHPLALGDRVLLGGTQFRVTVIKPDPTSPTATLRESCRAELDGDQRRQDIRAGDLDENRCRRRERET